MFTASSRICEITRTVLTELLQIPVTPASPPQTPHPQPHLLAWVRIVGDAEYRVIVNAPLPSARFIASSMFAMDAEALSHDDTCDALGEVANMIGGWVKGDCGAQTALSLPEVTAEHTTESPWNSGDFAWVDLNGRPLGVCWQCPSAASA